MSTKYIAICSKQSLPKIRAFVEGELRALDVKEAMTHQLVLAVDEACANSIIHQHSCDGKTRIQLSISRIGDALHIELIDKGDPFPIHEYKPQDLNEIIKDRKRGGLGIFLITKIMDKIELIQQEDNFTYRFTKYL